MEDKFFKVVVKNIVYYVRLLWSCNEQEDSSAAGVIGIYTYDSDGRDCDGGDLDVSEADYRKKGDNLMNYIDECLDFVGFCKDDGTSYDYTEMSEEEFDEVVDY